MHIVYLHVNLYIHNLNMLQCTIMFCIPVKLYTEFTVLQPVSQIPNTKCGRLYHIIIDLIIPLHVWFHQVCNLTTTNVENIPGSTPSSFNQKKYIICHSQNTVLYWECEGPASPVPMQPTNKELRISYVHEVNNNMTQLLSMSHT